jgi:hypothetical protein
MARHFFHTQTSIRFTDLEGLELSSHALARTEAVRTCGELMKDAPDGIWGTRPWSVTVTEANGTVLYEIMMDGSAWPAAG